MNEVEVIVVGGGPAGMMAAGRAAETGRSALLLEKNDRLGKKLELTGGGRCNITNAEFDTRAFLSHFGDARKFLFSPFSKFDARDTFDFFADLGQPLFVSEDRKRAFPESESAVEVNRALQAYMAEYDVRIRTGAHVTGLWIENGELLGVKTRDGNIRAESVVLATGGASYKATGSTGESFAWLTAAGHTVAEATPDIVPLRVKEAWVKELSGTSLEPMRIRFTATDGQTLAKSGKLLFTHFGLSGPLILNSANEVKKLLEKGPVSAEIDLFPNEDPPETRRRVLAVFDENKNKIARNTAKQLAPQGLAKALLANLPAELLEKKVNVVTREERETIVRALKGLKLTVTGTMGYDWAVVCDGGVPLTEVDTRTMASRVVPNLYIVGDLLHISRPSGGYSLQLCWTSGRVAGENA